MTPRLSNWPLRLHNFLRAEMDIPFQWGQRDCCTFAAAAIESITGIDPAAELRGTYASALSALRVLTDAGGVAGLAARQCAANGFPELPNVELAQRGDLMLCEFPDGDTLGICIGSTVAFKSAYTLTFYPVGRCRRAWKI